jgi:hypothetical protein
MSKYQVVTVSIITVNALKIPVKMGREGIQNAKTKRAWEGKR